MSVKRDIVLKVRVTADEKERWVRASQKAGARDLSTFIRETIEEEIQWEPVDPEQAAEVLKDVFGAEVKVDGVLQTRIGDTPLAEVAELADAPDSNPGEETREGSTPSLGTVCPRKFTHVPGVYCTACGTTPA